MGSATSIQTAAWTPPPTVTGVSATVNEEESKIELDWDISTLDASEFSKYVVYRRLFGGDWEVLDEKTSIDTTHHDDWTAGQTVTYEYKITQYKFDLESEDGDIITAQLASDTWFIVSGDHSLAFEVPVEEEQHSRVIQQEVFEPVSWNRKRVVRGETLGYEGQFTARFVVDEVEEAKANYSALAETPGPNLLKSAFGDVWFVEFDAPGYKYYPVGHMDVEMGWVEVGEDG